MARANAAVVSRPRVPKPVIKAADAASTVRRIRSNSRSPASISARVQPTGATTGTETLDQTPAPCIPSTLHPDNGNVKHMLYRAERLFPYVPLSDLPRS